MDDSQSQDRPECNHQSQEKPAVRNISTAPAFTTTSLLEAVIEEDETTARSIGGERTPDADDERGDEADDEMGDVSPSAQDSPDKSRHGSGTSRHHSPSRPGTSASRRGHSAHKTISRASSRKSRTSRQESDGSRNVGQSSDSESDTEDLRHRENRSDMDIVAVDITSEKDWDTDLETEEPSVTYDHSGKTTYIEACKKFGVVPASYFLRHMNDNQLSMKHHGLAGEGMRAISASLVSNATINTLDISDNWLGREGGLAVCEMLKENCFITDLNLSDNHLHLCAEQLCHIIEQNDHLRKVNLSGNGLDDQCAEHVANLIMNTAKLESLNLSHNNLGEKSGQILGPAISENLCLKELDLSWNHLRRKGAVAVASGIKNNVYMKRINLSWNGFGLEGSVALMDALKVNNVLEELDIMNNRITTEGAVLIGKGLTVNETLKVFKIGKNPMQSAGCWGIAAAILKNPNCILETLDFSDVLVNKDFQELWKQVEEQFPNLKLRHGGTELPPRPKQKVHPMVKLTNFITSHNIKLMDFFNRFDKGGSNIVTREEFKQGLGFLIQETALKLTEEEVEVILEEMNVNDNGEINYSELALGHTDFQEKQKKLLRPMTS